MLVVIISLSLSYVNVEKQKKTVLRYVMLNTFRCKLWCNFSIYI